VILERDEQNAIEIYYFQELLDLFRHLNLSLVLCSFFDCGREKYRPEVASCILSQLFHLNQIIT
jgi:hypothetical protein